MFFASPLLGMWAWLIDTLDAVLFPRDIFSHGEDVPRSIVAVQMFLGALSISLCLYVVLRCYRAVYRAYQNALDRGLWFMEHVMLLAALVCLLCASVCALWMAFAAPQELVVQYVQWLGESVYVLSADIGGAARDLSARLVDELPQRTKDDVVMEL